MGLDRLGSLGSNIGIDTRVIESNHKIISVKNAARKRQHFLL